MKRVAINLSLVTVLALTVASSAQAFGLKEHESTFTNADGSPATLAGAHPFAQTTTIAFNTEPGTEGFEIPAGAIKDLTVSLPPGFVGNTTVVPTCPNIDFETDTCPANTLVGTSVTEIFGPPQAHPQSVHELKPAPGSVASFGFRVTSVPVIIEL
jgi:hypothetical protein